MGELVVAALIASSCRFGGPSGDPTAPVVNDAASAGGSAGQAGNAGQSGGGSGGFSGEGGGPNPGGSGGGIADAPVDVADDNATSDGASDRDGRSPDVQGDAEGSDAESPDGGPTGCIAPFTSAVCDPVCNTGCTALLRCDTTDTARTGVCVGTLLSTVTEGMPCTRTAVTDDCAERLSCVDATCRRLCYRDTDCTTSGSCCNTALEVDAGPTGYRICAPCMP